MPKTGAALATLSGHKARVVSATFSPDSARICQRHSTTPPDRGMPRPAPFLPSCRGILVGSTAPLLAPTVAYRHGGVRPHRAIVGCFRRCRVGNAFGTCGSVITVSFQPGWFAGCPTALADKTAQLWDGKWGVNFASDVARTHRLGECSGFRSGRSRVLLDLSTAARGCGMPKTGAVLATLSGHTDRVFSAASLRMAIGSSRHQRTKLRGCGTLPPAPR